MEGIEAVLELLAAAAAELDGMGKQEMAEEVREVIAKLSAGGEDEEPEEEYEEAGATKTDEGV